MRVLAASSLTDAFNVVAAGFARDGAAGIEVHAGGSSALVSQLDAGIEADVLATADRATMQRAIDAGLIAGRTRVFATNHLEIAVAAGNPKRIATLADLARPGVLVSVAAADVPAGAYARQALASAGVELRAATEEANVRAVLTKVILGEVDAGIVYASDLASAAQGVEGVAIAAEHDVRASYHVAVVTRAGNPAGAARFIDALMSADGRAVLRRFGLGVP